MVEAARTCNDRLFRREPPTFLDAGNDRFSTLDPRVLHIHRTDTELLVLEQPFVMVRHIVFYQVGGTFDFADKIGLVSTGVEIAIPDLAIIFFADSVIALANVNRNMDVFGKVFDCQIDSIHGGPHSLSSAIVNSGSSTWMFLQPAAASILKLYRSSLPISS
jgi:hypothetical protein